MSDTHKEKDPAFLFYSHQFFMGVSTMSFEDRGKFITILCIMHQRGRLSEETIRLLVGLPSATLKAKFKIDQHGDWYNSRLEMEINKRQAFVLSRQKNGSEGGRPPGSKNKPNGYAHGKPIAQAKKNLRVIVINKDQEQVFNNNKQEEDLGLPFASDVFARAWEHWLKYRKEIKKPYKSYKSIEMTLFKLSKFSEEEAIKKIEYSITNGYQGLIFPDNNGNQKQQGTKGGYNSEDDLRAAQEKLRED